MLFGNKLEFAIEIEVNNLFYDEYIGEGKFLVYINNHIYGRNEEFATTFLCIIDQLKRFSEFSINANVDLRNFSGYEIALSYYCQNYSTKENKQLEEKLISDSKHLEVWSPESAFDDGSYVIHFDSDEHCRILAFKSCLENNEYTVNKQSVNEITIDSSVVKTIFTKAYLYLVNFYENNKKLNI